MRYKLQFESSWPIRSHPSEAGAFSAMECHEVNTSARPRPQQKKPARQRRSTGGERNSTAAPGQDPRGPRAGSLAWFLRVISRLPKAGNNHHPWPGNRSKGILPRGVRRGRRLTRPACKSACTPRAGPQLPLTPITPSSPLSKDHWGPCRCVCGDSKVGHYAQRRRGSLVDKSCMAFVRHDAPTILQRQGLLAARFNFK